MVKTGNIFLNPVLLLFVAVLNAPAAVLYVDVNGTNVLSPYSTWSNAATNIQDAVDAASPGDQVLVTNGNYSSGGRPFFSNTNRVFIGKAITVLSVNGPEVTTISGYQNPGKPNWETAIRCVWLTNGAVLSGFTLTNGDVSSGEGGGVSGPSTTLAEVATNCCVVSNCIIADCYTHGAIGCTLNNCTIRNNTNYYGWGGGVQTCVLNNCTLAGNNAGYGQGGGADTCVLNTCLLVGNTQTPQTGFFGGGGASRSTLNNCTLIGNRAADYGGGVYLSTLNSCLVFSNSASDGGGASYCTLNNCTIVSNSATNLGGGTGDGGDPKSVANNCIVYYNTAPTGSDFYGMAALNYCCTPLLPTNGVNNITNDPRFVDLANANFRLQSNSPCINAGENSYTTNNTELDGNPRIKGGTVDIGAYEYQIPTSILSYAWAQQYGVPTDGSADYLDSDGDGMNNWQEWIAGTIPTNANSILRLLSLSNSVAGNTVTWQSVNTRTYYVQISTNFMAQPAFTSIQSNLVGQAGFTSYTDPTATNGGRYFYRVGVQ